MKRSRVITLMTDFGQKGGFASALKGVILSINPDVQCVDITHEIQPQNVFEGAFTLLVNYRYFPKDTIHCAVVDPGVGSKRRILCARTPAGTFIGPDNGIFSSILERETKSKVYEVTNPKLFLPVVSNTFHGRDKMAPAAAHLSKGFPIEKVGPRIRNWVRLPFDTSVIAKTRVKGKVISVDRFGNLITNITGDVVAKIGDFDSLRVTIKNKRIPKMARYFSEAAKGELLAIVGSSNFVEIARNMGSAAEMLEAREGETVIIERV